MDSDFRTQKRPSLLTKLRVFFFGQPLDPFKPEARKNTVLIAFLAWIGLGADGLSSACYGPETAFLALGTHTPLALYLAIAICLTVIIIALGYNQVIELFPSGGGGYKVATKLIGPISGLTSGVALIVDYVLTIAVSIASCVEAFFSLLPITAQPYKLITEILLLALLGMLNLRSAKESIKILMPIFLTFFISHVCLIIYGIAKKAEHLPSLIPDTLHATANLGQQAGWAFVLALFLRAYSLGGGTYTGIEAVSNNVNRLMPPRAATGKWTMRYMAGSLAFTAGGIILLYLLWNVAPVPGSTLNAVAFRAIMTGWTLNGWDLQPWLLIIVMTSEAGLLLVAANTGYIDGPTVLANMAADSWVPPRFRHLSSRLVTQNGVLLMGISSGLVLLWTRGRVDLLIIMYSINVFLTFSLSLLGLCIYWVKAKTVNQNRILRFSLSAAGFLVTASILVITIFEKFEDGGWITLLITAFLIGVCLLIKQHYIHFQHAMDKVSEHFKPSKQPIKLVPALPMEPQQPTAIFFVGEHLGIGMYTLQKVLHLFPHQYKNFIFLKVGTIDSQNLNAASGIETTRTQISYQLNYLVNYCRSQNLPATYFQTYDTDVIHGLTRLAQKARARYPNSVFFAGTLIFEHDHWINHWLHNHTATLVQQRLQFLGMYMMLLPIRLAHKPENEDRILS